jgi:hypothetical protein
MGFIKEFFHPVAAGNFAHFCEWRLGESSVAQMTANRFHEGWLRIEMDGNTHC